MHMRPHRGWGLGARGWGLGARGWGLGARGWALTRYAYRPLAALTAQDWEQLKDRVERRELPPAEVLFDTNQPFDRVYFPESGVVSIVARFQRPGR